MSQQSTHPAHRACIHDDDVVLPVLAMVLGRDQRTQWLARCPHSGDVVLAEGCAEGFRRTACHGRHLVLVPEAATAVFTSLEQAQAYLQHPMLQQTQAVQDRLLSSWRCPPQDA